MLLSKRIRPLRADEWQSRDFGRSNAEMPVMASPVLASGQMCVHKGSFNVTFCGATAQAQRV